MSECEQWPDEQRIDAIGQNGNDGLHYNAPTTAPGCGWRKVVFAADCDEYGNCPGCGIDYAECECPGPTQDDFYEYRECDHGELWARPIQEDNPKTTGTAGDRKNGGDTFHGHERPNTGSDNVTDGEQ